MLHIDLIIARLMEDEKLSKQLISSALDIIQLSQHAMNPSGSGESIYHFSVMVNWKRNECLSFSVKKGEI